MKFSRQHLEGAFIALVLVAVSPLAVFAARTAVPIITGLFPTTLIVNMVAPTISMGNSTTTGSVYSNGGAALYFAVTVLDGAGGESSPSNLVASSTGNETHGWNLTWTATQGAKAYRVYFSTSTPQAMTQYFTSTSTSAYTFTSTSSPTFVPAGIPGTNTAYAIYISSTADSYLLGGKFGIGTSTPQQLLSVVKEPAGNGTVSTTTTLFGNQGTSTSRTCFNVVTSAGTAASFYVNGAGTVVVALAKCT